MLNKIAQINVGELKGLGELGENATTDPGGRLNTIISNIVTILTIIGAIWFIFIFVSGALAWIGSGGDKNALEAAKKRMVNGVIGIVVIVASLFIIEIFGNVIGIEILNPARYLDVITGTPDVTSSGGGRRLR